MSAIDDNTPEDHPDLREALKRCSPATYYAACKFRKTGEAEHLRAVILGVIERYVERELRPKLREPSDTLRLREDLSLDSLTMMEIVMVAEDVLPISITNEELTRLRTIGDVQNFFVSKVRGEPLPVLPVNTCPCVPLATNSETATPPAKIGASATPS